MSVTVALGLVLVVLGAVFFTAGTLGLIRFPDVPSRLHALTKADNLGLGLILAGTAVLLGSWTTAGLLALTWVMALAAASVSARLLAEIAADQEPDSAQEYDAVQDRAGVHEQDSAAEEHQRG